MSRLVATELKEVEVVILDKRLETQEWLPRRTTRHAAGLDLRAMLSQGTSMTLQPGEVQLVPTGISVWIRNPAYVGLIYPRSGTGHKQGLVLGNLTGVIDADYQGPLMVSLWNRSEAPRTIELGDRIAQMVFNRIATPTFKFVDAFATTTERNNGGFGHTGTK